MNVSVTFLHVESSVHKSLQIRKHIPSGYMHMYAFLFQFFMIISNPVRTNNELEMKKTK